MRINAWYGGHTHLKALYYVPETDSDLWKKGVVGGVPYYREANPTSAFQMTMTSEQVNQIRYSGIVQRLEANGFKAVHCHVNPNTSRKIVTLMAPPLVSDKKNVATQDPNIREYLFNTVTQQAEKDLTIFHAGACCGTKTVITDHLAKAKNEEALLKCLENIVKEFIDKYSPQQFLQLAIPPLKCMPVWVHVDAYFKRYGFYRVCAIDPQNPHLGQLYGFTTTRLPMIREFQSISQVRYV